jgi:hypothetical protein
LQVNARISCIDLQAQLLSISVCSRRSHHLLVGQQGQLDGLVSDAVTWLEGLVGDSVGVG